ncbi:BlaI/MecI/CopY family transcriptional regulator [bacterium]|nr:BlaI/MecI/CopY family transcriptional regulator [bacterium]
MAGRPKELPTPTEIEILNVLWRAGKASVQSVWQQLKPPKRAYTTVLTLLRIMERKGYVVHDVEGRAFIYRPILDEAKTRRSVIRRLIDRMFEGSAESLVASLLEREDISEQELRRLRRMIQQKERERK